MKRRLRLSFWLLATVPVLTSSAKADEILFSDFSDTSGLTVTALPRLRPSRTASS